MTEIFPWPVQEIVGWSALSKAAGFFLATFVLEDAAAIGAGLLLSIGAISWPAAFISCFLGIWLGDVGLYALARFGGRKWFEGSALKKFAPKIAAAEEWFVRRGAGIFILCRCVPGTRLPAYLAAGFLRVPLPRFLGVTGAAAFAWTFLILWLARLVGVHLLHWFNLYQNGALAVTAGLALFGIVRGLRLVVSAVDGPRLAARLERWRHWEFWPGWLFYPPVVMYCVWLAVKYRGVTLPTVSNPGIFAGGLVGESKMATLKNLMETSPDFTSVTELVSGDSFELRLRALEEIHARLDLGYPFVLKPDFGQRGAGIKIVRSWAQAENYLRNMDAPVLAQRYAPGPLEAGIFYYRFPGESKGHIFSITEKIFPQLTGDGRHTVAGLIELDPRARLIADLYLGRLADRRDEVLPAGQPLRLVEAGNHAQGCVFADGRRLASPALAARFEDISRKLDGFFIGRYDVRFASEADLRAGRNFQIVELNGAASEATSIYDARNSLASAYRTLFQQWNLVYAIGAENRRRGAQPVSLRAMWKKSRQYSRLARTYPLAD